MALSLRIRRKLAAALGAAAAVSLPPAGWAADPLPRSADELMLKRGQMGPGSDAFGARSWAPPPKKAKPVAAQEAASPPPAPPQPPALPFAYGGSGAVNGKRFVFLEQGNRSRMVSRGDVLDGAYRVEVVERSRVLLRYLPLDMVQVMTFNTDGGVPHDAGAPGKRPLARGPLFVDLPDELLVGQRRPLALGISPGSPAARATIEITYDAGEVAISGAKIMRPGKAVIEVNSQAPTPAEPVHLKAIAEDAVQTEIGIAVIAFDAQGRSVEVRGIPAQHIISLSSIN